ncbi:hypothetical protein LOZ80_00980 [Paenibacillus sp. HWE-109]|uniref:hypothetical protein n=1 Tax=Paenibacillus sp. HWE-109 TaxID=1306526 RepID=UPI001EDF9488|nr:hypothetical protein [Paenibacillus sp. HWE-109]UKS27557.1 hypothetical protein LOZ80_00980 [Paenibacillus sp. HWE-109]
MESFGYQYSKHSGLSGDIAFLKEVSGFDVGLLIYFHGKSISAGLKTCIDDKSLDYLVDGSNMSRNFDNQIELEVFLEDIKSKFVSHGDNYIKQRVLENFDPHHIYTSMMDEYLKKHNYYRKSSDSNLLVGGKVVYSKEDEEIIFDHGALYTCISCKVKTKRANLHETCLSYEDRNWLLFLNEKEYVEKIMIFHKILESKVLNSLT